MYTDICNFPTSSKLLYHLIMQSYFSDMIKPLMEPQMSRAERGGITSINGTLTTGGEESTLVIVTTRGGSGHYKWSVRGTDGERAGETSKSGSLCCVMASAYL